MVMMYETLALALAAIITPLFAKLAGYELRRKPFEFVGGSGLFFLLTIAFTVLPIQESVISGIWFVCSVISYFIGWAMLLIGAIWELIDVFAVGEVREHP
jgi:hypothetical protein